MPSEAERLEPWEELLTWCHAVNQGHAIASPTVGQVAKLAMAVVAEVGTLSILLHEIAVARRGDCPDVDENWDDLPEEIETMWQWLNG